MIFSLPFFVSLQLGMYPPNRIDVFLAKFTVGQHVAKFKKHFSNPGFICPLSTSSTVVLSSFLQPCLHLAPVVLCSHGFIFIFVCSSVAFAGSFVSSQLGMLECLRPQLQALFPFYITLSYQDISSTHLVLMDHLEANILHFPPPLSSELKAHNSSFYVICSL